MHLNLQILRDELAPLIFEAAYTNAPTEYPCAYPEPYTPGSMLLSHIVYLVRSEDLPRQPDFEGHPSLICIGKPPIRYRREPFNILWTDNETTVGELLRLCLSVFERYYQWESSMQRVIDDGRPIKEIGLLSEPFFNNPIYLQGSSFKVYFHIIGSLEGLSEIDVENYKTCYASTEIPLKDNSYLPIESINALINDRAYHESADKRGPALYGGIGYDFDAMFYNIGPEGGYVARLIVDNLKHAFTERDYALSKILGDFLEKALYDKDVESFERPSNLDEILEGLLSHRLQDENKISSVLQGFRWGIDDTFFCMVLESKSEEHNRKTLKTLAIQLTLQLPSECYVVFNNQLIFIFDLTNIGLTQEQTLKRVIPTLRDNLMNAGISNAFNGFMSLYYYYLQAQSALRIGGSEEPDSWYYRYEDYHLTNMIRRCRGKLIPEATFPRGLVQLIEYDSEKGTDLVNLLRIYLTSGLNIAETTRTAYIHRSTCLYRLKRISEISHLNLEDADTWLELGIAFKVMDECLPPYTSAIIHKI